jgi:signal transduction histidine kinase
MQLFLICLLSAACLVLLYKQLIVNANFRKILAILEDVHDGNSNRRFYPTVRFRYIKQFCAVLNKIMNKYEETNLLKQNLEASQKQMISDISHDLRTPLASLMGYIKALKNDQTLTDIEKRNYLDILWNKSNLMYKLLEDFFEMAKLESDDMELILQKVDLVEKVKQIIISYYQDFMQNNLSANLQLPENTVYAKIDISAFERILNNLISNAMHYGRDGKIIGVSMREDHDVVWVDVWDCGMGINERDLPYIFDRLYTTEKSRNSNLRGTGLGLAITKRLVEKMGGGITVSSVSGEKTTFSLYLPKYN